MASRLTKYLNLTFLIIGVGLLVGLLFKMDTEVVGARLVQVGWFFPPAFASYVLGLFLTASAWRCIVDPAASRATYRDFLAALWAGHAVNQVTPTASLGEVFKGTILKGKVDGEELVASLITFNFMSTFVVQIFTILGPVVVLFAVDLSSEVILTLFGAAFIMFIPVGLLALLLRWGVASKVVGLLQRLPLVKFKDPDALLAKARSIDERIRRFRKCRPKKFLGAVFCLFLVRLCQVAELWFILMGLLPDESAGFLLMLALLTQTATQLIAWVMTFVPGQVGVAEGGSALLFQWLGMDPLTGFSMEIMRRIRKLLGISIGLVIGCFVVWRKK